MRLYRLKRALLAPYLWCMRRVFERDATGVRRDILEAMNYSPAFYRLERAFKRNPDILYEAPGLGPRSVVFDVGAFDGAWAARVFKRFRAHVYTFELEPGLCARLERRFRHTKKIQRFDFGLGARNAELWLTRDAMGSTLYPQEDLATADRVMAPVRDVVEVLDELGRPQIDLMKVNIEGGEYDLLERMIEADRMRSVRCLTVQFHEWIDGAYRRRSGIRKALRRTHRLVWDYPFCWEMWERKDSEHP